MSDPNTESIGQFLLYQTEDGGTRVQVRLEDETLWMTRAGMAELFQITPQGVTLHLRRIFSEKELLAERVSKYYFTTAADGKDYRTGFYNLDAILAVGYRVRRLCASLRPRPFRRHDRGRLTARTGLA